MKLDAGTQSMFEFINKPFSYMQLDDICKELREFDGNLSIQSLFLRGKLDDSIIIDNTTDEEIAAWLRRLTYIEPHKVILYSIDRETPATCLEKIDKNILFKIAAKVQSIGIKTECF
jgi:wyosine [tRNA(Phe)-imidazoG37] synthetase (radical SAM superfamily)